MVCLRMIPDIYAYIGKFTYRTVLNHQCYQPRVFVQLNICTFNRFDGYTHIWRVPHDIIDKLLSVSIKR